MNRFVFAVILSLALIVSMTGWPAEAVAYPVSPVDIPGAAQGPPGSAVLPAVYLPLAAVNAPPGEAVRIRPYSVTVALSRTVTVTMALYTQGARLVEARVHSNPAALPVITATMMAGWCDNRPYARAPGYIGWRCESPNAWWWEGDWMTVELSATQATSQALPVEAVVFIGYDSGFGVFRRDVAWVSIERLPGYAR